MLKDVIINIFITWQGILYRIYRICFSVVKNKLLKIKNIIKNLSKLKLLSNLSQLKSDYTNQ